MLVSRLVTFGELQSLIYPGLEEKSNSLACTIVISHDRDEYE